VGKPIKIEQTKVKKEKPAPAKTSKTASILMALLCVAIVFLSFFAISLNNKYEKSLEHQEEILADISSQQKEIENLNNKIEEQKTEIGKQDEIIHNQAEVITNQQKLLYSVLESISQPAASDLLEMLETHELTLPNQDELISELKVLLEKEPQEVGEAYKVYTVVAGDTLSKICAANNLDYGTYYSTIIAINEIKDPNLIYVGQTILLPVVDNEQ
jgi:nucleoid-associated protein YgaU